MLSIVSRCVVSECWISHAARIAYNHKEKQPPYDGKRDRRHINNLERARVSFHDRIPGAGSGRYPVGGDGRVFLPAAGRRRWCGLWLGRASAPRLNPDYATRAFFPAEAGGRNPGRQTNSWSSQVPERLVAVSEIITLWYADPQFLDDGGAPRSLPLTGPSSFATLTAAMV